MGRSNNQSLDVEERRQLRLLEALHGDQQLTQRGLSTTLGIALGLTNLYLKRLARKGYIKCVNVRRNRVLYLITPKGLAEKARLTYHFMEHSLRLYRQTREHLRAVLEPIVTGGCRRVAIYGTGEPAELAYISLKEQGLEPVAVFDGTAGGRFLDLPVRALAEHETLAFDMLIVATLDDPGALIERLQAAGISPDKLCTLRPHRGAPVANGRRRAASGGSGPA